MGSDFFIPDFAFKRPIGNYPEGLTGKVASFEGMGPKEVRTKRGIPLGGIGTGSLMFNLAGSFGPFNFDIGGDDSEGSVWGSEDFCGFENRFLIGAGFHIFYQSKETSNALSLMTEDHHISFNPIKKDIGTYYALFPKSWFDYDLRYYQAPVELKLEQLSPYVINDEFWLSMPSALFRFRVKNSSDIKASVSLAFSFPNAPYRLDSSYDLSRAGLFSEVVDADNFVSVALNAKGGPAVETQDTQWVIATLKEDASEITYISNWDFDDDASTTFDYFRKTGRFLNDNSANNAKGGAIANKLELEPGEEKIVCFALAWDFPLAQFQNPEEGTIWKKRYTEFFDSKFAGVKIAKHLLENESNLRQAVDSWWLKIVNSDKIPNWLKMAGLNELYYDIFGGSFWENGCLTKEKKFGNRPNQHLSFVLECNGFRDCETFDLHHYEARRKIYLTQKLERDFLLGYGDLILDEPKGRTPHDVGSPVRDPWFIYSQYFATAPRLDPVTVSFKDQPFRFIQVVHAYFKVTNDMDFLQEIYPSVDKTFKYIQSLDEDGDSLVECMGFDTSYDGLGLRGVTCHVASLQIAALEALREIQNALSIEHNAPLQMLDAARDKAERLLWDEEKGYYRAATIGEFKDFVMADALCGQRYVEVFSLPDVFELSKIARHLHVVYDKNVENSKGMGALNLVDLNGVPPNALMAKGIWPGGTYFIAAQMIRTGKRTNDDELIEKGFRTAKFVVDCTYFREEIAFWFNTPAIWYPPTKEGELPQWRSQQNARPRAVWETLFESHNPFE